MPCTLHMKKYEQVIYIVVLTSACVVNAVNLLATLGALKARSIFTPLPRWSPLMFADMIHEASAIKGCNESFGAFMRTVKQIRTGGVQCVHLYCLG